MCNSQYPTLSIADCTTLVSKSLEHYGKIDNNWVPDNSKDVSSEANNFFNNILETVGLEIETFSSNNFLSHIMESASCKNLDEETNCHYILKSGLKKINNWLKSSETKTREKRGALSRRKRAPMKKWGSTKPGKTSRMAARLQIYVVPLTGRVKPGLSNYSI